MRILLVNDGVDGAGGVQQYLRAIAPALRARGHELALLHLDVLSDEAESPIGAGAAHFHAGGRTPREAVRAAIAWNPAVVFSHNMRDLRVEQQLLAGTRVVKMMHGYFGTCIGGHKMHAFPGRVACDRRFGVACAALYLPRRCGRWKVGSLTTDYAWARRQRALLDGYSSIVVASEHMRREYLRHGIAPERVVSNVLFATEVPSLPAPRPDRFRVAFLGRMTPLKGGDLLIRAVAEASESSGDAIAVTLAGDGPSRHAWEELARTLQVAAEFPGWIDGTARAALYAAASVVAVPSLWPEPFGLTGLEGGAFGAAAVAFDVGGIRSWLRDGENGWLVPAHTGAAGFARALVEAQRHERTLVERRAAARRAAETLSLARHVDQLDALLTTVAGAA